MLSHWRRWLVAIGLFAVVVAAAWLGISWHYSNVLDDAALDAEARRESLADPEFDDTELVSLQPETITVSLPDDPDSEVIRPGTWGIEWEGGYAVVAEITATDDSTVTRRLTQFEGSEPAPATPLEFEGKAVPRDGGQFIRENATMVDVPGPLGVYPSRFVPATGSTWALLVNGNGLDWRDLARLAPALHAAGYPVLFVTYRNMPGAPEDPDGRLTYGVTEWEDLDAAVRFALESGASDVVLIAASMGGAVAMSFFVNAPETASSVRAVVFDSPLLSFRRAVDFQASQTDLLPGIPLPDALTATATWLADFRFDVDWDATNYLDDGDTLPAPALVFHGDDDDDVPLATSQEFAAANPDAVTLVEVAGAGHIQSWNIDPAAYESRLLDFLSQGAN